MTKAITTISNSQFSATGQFVSLAETNVVRINFGETVLPTDATTFFAGKILIGMDLEVRVGPQGSTITYTAASTNKPADVAALFAAFDAVKLPGIPTLKANIETLRSDITGGAISATSYDTLVEISNALEKLNGADIVTGSVANSIKTAIGVPSTGTTAATGLFLQLEGLINTAVGAVQTQVTNLGTTVGNLSTASSTQAGQIAAIIDNSTANTPATDASLAGLANSVTAIKTALGTAFSASSTVGARLTDLENQLLDIGKTATDNVKAQLDAITGGSALTSASYKTIADLSSALKSLETVVGVANTATSGPSNATGLYALIDTNNAAQTAAVTALDSKIGSPSSGSGTSAVAATGYFAAIETLINTAVGAVQIQVTNLGTTVGNLSTASSTQAGQIAAIIDNSTANTPATDASLAGLANSVTAIKTALGTAFSASSTVGARLTDLENQLLDIGKTATDNVKAQLDAITGGSALTSASYKTIADLSSALKSLETVVGVANTATSGPSNATGLYALIDTNNAAQTAAVTALDSKIGNPSSGSGASAVNATGYFATIETLISNAVSTLEAEIKGAGFSPTTGLATLKAIADAIGYTSGMTPPDANSIMGRLAAIEAKLAALDTIAPTVQSITLSATGQQNDKLNAGDVITATVKFSEAVGVEGTPTVALGGITGNKFATYASGAGSDTLVFTYTVASGDSGASITAADNALALGMGGRIIDLSNNAPASLVALTSPAPLSLAIDTGAPEATLTANTITSAGSATVSSTEAGTAYLVNEKVLVTSLASITSATDDLWNSVPVTTVNSPTSLAATGLINGTYKLYTVDAAGNLSAASGSSVTIDTPVNAGDIRFVNLTDTGTSEPGNPVTRDNNFSLQRVGGNAMGDVVDFEVSTNSGLTWSSTGATQTGLQDGTYLFRAKVTAGGNTSYTAPISVTIDTTPDASGTVMVTAISEDTGSSATDGITSDTTPTLTITAAPNSTVEVLRGGTKVGEAMETATSGTYTFTDTTLSAGTYAYTARTIDAAGNMGVASAAKSVTIDTTVPTATVALASSALKAGETTEVTITFSEAVTGFTNDDLTIANGSLTAVSSVDSGVTWTATFTPTADLEDATNVITLANTGVVDVAGNAGTGTTDSNNYTIDTKRPTVTISDNKTGVATDAGNTVLYTFQFSESVTGFDGTDVLVTGGTAGTLTVTDADTYTLEVTATDNSTANLSVTVKNTNLVDAAGNLMLADAVDANQAVDTKNPAITTIALTADSEATYSVLNEGDTVTATVTFDDAVTVTGTPQLALNIGSTPVQANYAGGTGTNALTFTYTILANQTDTDGISIDANALTLNSGTIKDANGNDAVLTSALVAANGDYKVDTAAPTATVALASSALKAGETTEVTITFSEAVTGFTNDDLTIANGSLTAVSSVDSGVTWTATFTPTADLEDATNVITLANTGVVDVAGNAGTGTTDSNNYTIDTKRPTVTISDNKTGVATDAGNTVLYTFQFSESVTGFDGTDVLVTGGTAGTLTVTDADTYTLEVTATDNSTANLSVTVKNTNLVDAAGNLMLADAVDANQAVDTKNPAITTIALTADSEATYSVLNEGDTVTATVTFDDAVTVTGTPQLALNIGSTPVQANYAGGTGTNALTFTYTILANQTDTDGISIDANALTLNSGTIKDANGNDAVLTSALVAANGDYKVDTTAPNAPSITGFSDDSGVQNDGRTNDKSPTLTITAEAGSTVEVFHSNVSVGTATESTQNAGTFTFTSADLADADYSFTAKATDLAGNVSGASSALSITVDTVAPIATVTTVTSTGFTVDSDEDGKVNNRAASSITATPDVTVAVTEGTLATVTLAATDAAGNSRDVTFGASGLLITLSEGSSGNDSQTTAAGKVGLLYGFAGNDELAGGALNDYLYGGTGSDVILGGAGDDTIDFGTDTDADVAEGSLGSDTITIGDNAGAALDEVHFSSLDGTDTVNGLVLNGGSAATNDFIAFLDNNNIVTPGAVNFAASDLLSGPFGTRFTAADEAAGASYAEFSTVTNLAATHSTTSSLLNQSNKVLVVNTTNEATIIANSFTALGLVNAYIVVGNGSNTEIYFDADWNTTADRTKVATLVGVSIADIDVTDFGVYSTI